jgi:hypothetical protein
MSEREREREKESEIGAGRKQNFFQISETCIAL